MSFSGLFAVGLSGVNAYANSLESISQNIANTQTTGYKRAQTDFSTLVTSLSADGGAIQGGGVASTVRTNFSEQGAITRTGSSTDLAIAGDGFFVVSEAADGSQPNVLTRSGGFSALENGDLVNDAGYFLRGAPISDNGNVALGSLNGLQTININTIPNLAEATSAITLAGSLSTNAVAGSSAAQNIQLFDADGNARNLLFTVTALGDGNFDAIAQFTDGAQEVLSTGSLIFNANGQLDQGASSFALSGTAANGQSLDLDIASLTTGSGSTQFTTASANGAALGVLTGVEISADGRVSAQFSNGLSRDIFQIAIANVVNAEGLEEGPASTFSLTSAAGDVSLDIPQSGRAGAIEGSALEISTVDIGQEFSALIETQRAYSANTRVISLADELWQTLTQTAR